jgi:hypothetical protein
LDRFANVLAVDGAELDGFAFIVDEFTNGVVVDGVTVELDVGPDGPVVDVATVTVDVGPDTVCVTVGGVGTLLWVVRKCAEQLPARLPIADA